MSQTQRIEPFLEFLDGLPSERRDEFAREVCRERYGDSPGTRTTSYPYLRLVALGHSKASAELARAIELASARFGEPIPKAIFRPDIFGPPPSASNASHP